MNNIKNIFRKELRSLFDSPIAYIVIVLFLVASGTVFFLYFFTENESSMRLIFGTAGFLVVIFSPAITMGLLAEEKKIGTLELLVTKPILEHEIIIGKFLSAWTFLLVMFFPTLVYLLTIIFLGKIDFGPVFSGYLGLLLVGGVYISFGVLCSSITESQIIALLLSLVVTLFLYGLDWILPFFPSGIITSTFEYISTGYHFANIKRGVIDTRDLVYYFSMIGLSLLIASVMLEKRKW